MSDLKNKKIEDVGKDNTNEPRKSNLKIKNNKSSTKKKVGNNQKLSNKINKLTIKKGIDDKLNQKSIVVERKLNTSMSSRNKNNITIDHSFYPPNNEKIVKKDYSFLLTKKIDKKNNNDNKNDNNRHYNNYKENKSYVNIKNIIMEKNKQKPLHSEQNNSTSNTKKKNKKKELEIDSTNNNNNNFISLNNNAHTHSNINNNNNNNNEKQDNIKNIYNNNLITNNIININGFLPDQKIRQIYKSKNNSSIIKKKNKNKIMDKSIDIYLIQSHPSLSNMGSISNGSRTINPNNSSSAKDILRNYKKYKFNHNTIYNYNSMRSKRHFKSKKNISIKIGHKNNNYMDPIFKESRSLYNLSVESVNNKIKKMQENKDKRNNSISFRNRVRPKIKENGSAHILINKFNSPQAKKIQKIRQKINDSNNNDISNTINNISKIKCKNSHKDLITKEKSDDKMNNNPSSTTTSNKRKNKIFIKDNHNINKDNKDKKANPNSFKIPKKKKPSLVKNKEDMRNKMNNNAFLISSPLYEKWKQLQKLKENNTINNINTNTKNNNKNNNIVNHKIKYDFKLNNKNKEKKNYEIKSPLNREEDDNSKEIFTSPVSTSRHSNANNIYPIKEYPNMALSPTKITPQKEINKKLEKKIRKIQYLCKVGCAGPNQKKLNQDNYFIQTNFLNNPSYSFIGVLDGHGIFGQNISSYLQEHLPKNVQEGFLDNNIKNLNDEKIKKISQVIENIYIKTNKEMNEDERIDSSFSGSTSVSILFTPDRILCINVGDSRCILGKFNKAKNKWLSMNLSRDHKPSDPDEKERINKHGGKVEPYMDEEGNFLGPERVWVENEDSPGLAMSRSFGDEIAHRVGVIVSPEIYDYRFIQDDKFIILASDGIWEFISSYEAVDIVKIFYLKNDLEGALDFLYNESVKRWMSRENIIDDITIIIAFLD